MKIDKSEFTSWHVGVAAEAIAAAQFARCGIAISVQYGANQPEYDLVAVKGDKMLKSPSKEVRMEAGVLLNHIRRAWITMRPLMPG